MNKLSAGLLTAIFSIGTIAAASAQQYPYPGQNGQYGQYGQYGQHGNGRRHRNRNNNCNGNAGYGNYNNGRHNENDENDGDQNENENQNQNNGGNYNNGNYNNGNYNNGNYNNGRYNCANGGANGNAVVTGVITAVNGNVLTIQRNPNGQYGQYPNGQYGQYPNGQYGQYPQVGGPVIRINDQPALDNRATGRISIGRYVTAYGYWSNGTFFATRLT